MNARRSSRPWLSEGHARFSLSMPLRPHKAASGHCPERVCNEDMEVMERSHHEDDQRDMQNVTDGIDSARAGPPLSAAASVIVSIVTAVHSLTEPSEQSKPLSTGVKL